jgi:hypothetical protein
MPDLSRNAAVAVATVADAARTGVRLVGRLTGGSRTRRDSPGRWLGVTVLRAPEEVAVSGPDAPEPLRRLGTAVELRVKPAPGDRGAELYARPLATGTADSDRRRELRAALREAKALLETGEVVRPSGPSTTRPGPAGRVLAAVDRAAQGEGRL